jgi:hypothetical protein
MVGKKILCILFLDDYIFLKSNLKVIEQGQIWKEEDQFRKENEVVDSKFLWKIQFDPQTFEIISIRSINFLGNLILMQKSIFIIFFKL